MGNQLTLTAAGQTSVANALLSGIPLRVSFLAVGSGDGTLLGAASTHLGTEVARVPIAAQTTSGNQVTFEGVIPASIGPFTMSEVGLYDNTNTLIAVGALPAIYKPAITNGFSVAVRILATIAFSTNPAATTVVVGATDPGIYYTPNGTRVRFVVNDDLTFYPQPF